jgi:hypothetical protein
MNMDMKLVRWKQKDILQLHGHVCMAMHTQQVEIEGGLAGLCGLHSSGSTLQLLSTLLLTFSNQVRMNYTL